MFATEPPLVPLETDRTTLQLRIHSVASLYLMKGKSGNLLLMNLECKKKKKMPLFAENGIKLLVQGKQWLEPIQDLIKDPYRERAGGKCWGNADSFNSLLQLHHQIHHGPTLMEGCCCLGGLVFRVHAKFMTQGLYAPWTSTRLRGGLNGARPAERRVKEAMPPAAFCDTVI